MRNDAKFKFHQQTFLVSAELLPPAHEEVPGLYRQHEQAAAMSGVARDLEVVRKCDLAVYFAQYDRADGL